MVHLSHLIAPILDRHAQLTIFCQIAINDLPQSEIIHLFLSKNRLLLVLQQDEIIHIIAVHDRDQVRALLVQEVDRKTAVAALQQIGIDHNRVVVDIDQDERVLLKEVRLLVLRPLTHTQQLTKMLHVVPKNQSMVQSRKLMIITTRKG